MFAGWQDTPHNMRAGLGNFSNKPFRLFRIRYSKMMFFCIRAACTKISIIIIYFIFHALVWCGTRHENKRSQRNASHTHTYFLYCLYDGFSILLCDYYGFCCGTELMYKHFHTLLFQKKTNRSLRAFTTLLYCFSLFLVWGRRRLGRIK